MAAQEVKGGRVPVLQFLDRREQATAWDLVNEFDYTYNAARSVLNRLHYQRLITRIDTGVWTLTDLGRDRLHYLKRKRGG